MPKTCQNNLTLFAKDTLASHSPLPRSKEAKKMTVTSGRKCFELSRTAPPLGSLLKMLLVTSDWASTVCFLTWKVLATPHNRLLFRLVPSMLRTDETESGLLPTPSSSQCETRPAQTWNPKSQSGRSLGCMAATGKLNLWMTPTAQYYKRRCGPKSKQQGLSTQVLWATPNTMDYLPPRSPESLKKLANGHRKGRSRPSNLREQVDETTMKLWPTLRASEYKETRPVVSKSHQHMKDRHYLAAEVKDPGKPSGKLNPKWVEWLMGYPIGWTELNALETP